MIVRFFNADRDVVGALARAVASMPKFLLLTQLKGPRTLALEGKSPFKEILAAAGHYLDVVVVIDDGSPEGMWRDPFGELCDRLFQDRKDASAATSGWVIAQGGQALGQFRKSLWDPVDDAETITEFLAPYVPGMTPFSREVKPPEPSKKPVGPSPRRTKTPVINPAVRPGAARRPDGGAEKGRAGERSDTPVFTRAVAPNAGGPRAGARRDTPVFTKTADAPPDLKTQEMPRVVVEAAPPPLPPPEAPPPEPPPMDPYAVLGVSPGVTFDEVKKTYRSLIIQYHPDKVAHLGAEFRSLAEKRTLDLNQAFQMLEKSLKG